MRAAFIAMGLVGALAGSGARAAIVITSTLGNEAGTITQTMYLGFDALKRDGTGGTMLYRGDQDKVFTIDDDRHSYMDMSSDGMMKLKAQSNAAVVQMQQQIAAMPEAQRKAVEAAMAAHGMPPATMQASAPPPVISYEKGGAVRKVGKWNCQPYTMLFDGKPQADLCVAKLSDLGLTRSDLKPFIGFQTHIREQLSPSSLRMGPTAAVDFDALNRAVGYDCLPVESTYTLPNVPQRFTTTIQSIERKDLPAGSFDIPVGYTKHDIAAPGSPQ